MSSLWLSMLLAAQALTPPPDIARVLDDHCVGCHGSKDPEAGLDLSQLAARPLGDALGIWLLARDKVAARVMPPLGYSEPSANEIASLVAWINQIIDARQSELVWPARAAGVRRLSRSQYERAVADLFGVAVPAAAEFPQDDLAFGFDTLGQALSFTALHVEKYLAAAEAVAAAVIDDVDPAAPPVRRIEAEDMVGEPAAAHGDFVNLYTASELSARVSRLRAGQYTLRVRAFGDQAGDAAPQLVIDVDGAQVTSVDVEAVRAAPRIYESRLELAAGEHALRLAFVNDYYEPSHPDPKRRDRNLHLDWLELVGPQQARPVSLGSQWWFARDPEVGPAPARLRAMLTPLVERAWRVPIADAEIDRVVGVATAALARGEAWPGALRLAVTTILLSPQFLLRAEDADPSTAARALQLATRLSFFLWGSVPDAVLLAQARDGALSRDEVLLREVQRMLADARASALATDFAAQAFELRQLPGLTFDPARYAGITPQLLHDMRRETELLFEAFLREGRPARDLLVADFTFLNQRLAEHYGVDGSFDDELRRVPVTDADRRGLLAHASILALTSNPTRTSPVKRGKWILEHVLGAPPPAPPPGSDSFAEGTVIDTAASLRAQMALHRSKESCAVCHARMDGLGLALERFDAVGRWRMLAIEYYRDVTATRF